MTRARLSASLVGCLALVACSDDTTPADATADLASLDLPADLGRDAPPDGSPPDLGLPVDLGCPGDGMTACGGACVNTSSDPEHCGGCGQACPPDLDCVDGACTCAVGGRCDGCCDGDTCVPTGATQSTTRCGKNGEACTSCDDGLSCSVDTCSGQGLCQNTPQSGYCLIDGACHVDGAYKSTAKCLQCQSAKRPLAWTGLPNKGCVATLAGTGIPGFLDGPVDQAVFQHPRGMAVDSAGVVYVADEGNHRIRSISGGQVKTFAGTGQNLPIPIDGVVSSATFNHPHGVFLDGSGALYVAGRSSNRIRVIAGGKVSTLAGFCTGYLDGPASSACFNQPVGVAADSAGTVYVADSVNHVIRTVQNNQVATLAGLKSSTGGFADGPAAVAEFRYPQDVLLTGSGALLVSDSDNHSIRRIENNNVTTFAGTGASGMVDGALSVAQFSGPAGLALDGTGALLVADRLNHRIRKITGTQVSTLAGSGTKGYADGPLLSAQLNEPAALAVDSTGKIYVADGANHSIRVIVP